MTIIQYSPKVSMHIDSVNHSQCRHYLLPLRRCESRSWFSAEISGKVFIRMTGKLLPISVYIVMGDTAVPRSRTKILGFTVTEAVVDQRYRRHATLWFTVQRNFALWIDRSDCNSHFPFSTSVSYEITVSCQRNGRLCCEVTKNMLNVQQSQFITFWHGKLNMKLGDVPII